MASSRSTSRHLAPRRTPRLSPSLVISVLALLIATSGGAYALSLGSGEVRTRHLATGAVTTPKLDQGAVTSSKVKEFGLRLNDLGGRDDLQTRTTTQTLSIPANECRRIGLATYNPAPAGVIGSLVVGYVTSPDGGAVLSNSGVVVPTMVSETSQGGAVVNLVVCASSAETVPVGSLVHFRMIGPGR